MPPSLQPFLQGGLGVFLGMRRTRLQARQEQTADNRRRCVVSGIKMHSADDGLQSIGQDGSPLRATALGLAFAQTQERWKARLHRDGVQTLFADELRAHSAEFTFTGLGVLQEQQVRHREVQNRVAQELQALVVRAAVAAVRERALQQTRVAKAMPERAFERCCIDQFDCPSYFSSK